MFYDIVFPKNNEKEFIAIAEKLQIGGICFTYQFIDRKSIADAKESVSKLQQATQIKLAAAFTAAGSGIHKIHDLNETAIAEASENSRDIVAKCSPELVYNLELSAGKDFAKTRNSGLDKPTCQFARENNVIIAFSFSAMLNSANQQKIIGRIMQNIKLCRKYKAKTAIASFAEEPYGMRSPHDLKSFLLSFGMDTASAKKSIEAAAELFSQPLNFSTL